MSDRISRQVEIAIIGGTSLESLLDSAEQVHVGTPHGFPPIISIGEVEGRNVAFLPRRGYEHSVPPHRVNYRANIHALYEMGTKRIAAEIKGRLTSNEVIETSKLVMSKIQQILIEAIHYLPKKRHCQCASALEDARTGGERRC